MAEFHHLFQARLGDPITSLFINERGCMAGSVLGKVWLYDFEATRVEELACFSDEGVRGLYLDQHTAYATICEGARGWSIKPPFKQTSTLAFRNIDGKSTQNVKIIVQRGPLVCVLFAIATSIVNVENQEHHSRSFKICDYGPFSEVALCDFDGETLALIDRARAPEPPTIRLVQLERGDVIELSSLPGGSRISLLRLWGPDCLVYVMGNELFVYDYKLKEPRFKLRGHRSEIVAVDAHDPGMLATLSSDATVKLWMGKGGDCFESLKVPDAGYFQGFPYFLQVSGMRIIVSCDEGVVLINMSSQEGP